MPHMFSSCLSSQQWLACTEFQDTLKDPAISQVLIQTSFKEVLESFYCFDFLAPSPPLTDTQ